eukprot:g2809.t1
MSNTQSLQRTHQLNQTLKRASANLLKKKRGSGASSQASLREIADRFEVFRSGSVAGEYDGYHRSGRILGRGVKADVEEAARLYLHAGCFRYVALKRIKFGGMKGAVAGGTLWTELRVGELMHSGGGSVESASSGDGWSQAAGDRFPSRNERLSEHERRAALDFLAMKEDANAICASNGGTINAPGGGAGPQNPYQKHENARNSENNATLSGPQKHFGPWERGRKHPHLFQLLDWFVGANDASSGTNAIREVCLVMEKGDLPLDKILSHVQKQRMNYENSFSGKQIYHQEVGGGFFYTRNQHIVTSGDTDLISSGWKVGALGANLTASALNRMNAEARGRDHGSNNRPPEKKNKPEISRREPAGEAGSSLSTTTTTTSKQLPPLISMRSTSNADLLSTSASSSSYSSLANPNKDLPVNAKLPKTIMSDETRSW